MFHISCSHSGFWFHTLSHFAVTKRSHCSLGTFLGDRGHERRRRRPSSDICHRPAVWSSWPSNTSAEVLGDNEVKTFISIEGSRIWMRKSKGNQGRYRIIDCTIYIHHQFSSIIHYESSIIHHESSIIHQSCIYIWCYSHTYKDLLHQTVKTYCYRQNNFLLTSAPLIRSASKTSMSCLSFFLWARWFFTSFIAWALQPLRFQVSWPSDDFIGIPRQVDVFLEDIHHQQLLPLEAQACLQGIQDTEHLDLEHSPWPGVHSEVVCPGMPRSQEWYVLERKHNKIPGNNIRRTVKRLHDNPAHINEIQRHLSICQKCPHQQFELISLLWFVLIAFPRILLCSSSKFYVTQARLELPLFTHVYMGNLYHHRFKHYFPPTPSEAQRRSLVHLGL